jgi:thiol:disulfide interchange protein DsbA
MKKFLTVCGFFIAVLFSSSSMAEFDEGHEYNLLDGQPPVANGAPIEVVEFFWYGCPHCYHFEPYVKKWLAGKSQDMKFIKVPASFHKSAKFHAYVYYALDLMGEAERLNDVIFEAMHKQGKKLANQQEVESFLSEHNVDIATFKKAMKTFAVENRVKRAASLFNKYQLRGVPAVVVNGRYASGEVKNYQHLLEVIDYMIHLVKEEQKNAD